jgi:inorganic pyrophosphatase
LIDEAGGDDKLLCEPADDPRWDRITDIGHVSMSVLDTIEHFFEHYKDLEPGNYVKAVRCANR